MEIMRKGFWRTRRWYQRLDEASSSGQKRRTKRVVFGPGRTTRKRRFWRIRILPRLRLLKRASPKRLLVWLRDAYVNMMLRLAKSAVIGYAGYGEGIWRGPAMKEYDEKMLVEIYKSILLAKGHLVHPDDAPKIGSELQVGNSDL